MNVNEESVAKWFREVGNQSNEQLYLNIEPGRAYISDGAGTVATMMMDWSVNLEAPTLACLAIILDRDCRLAEGT